MGFGVGAFKIAKDDMYFDIKFRPILPDHPHFRHYDEDWLDAQENDFVA